MVAGLWSTGVGLHAAGATAAHGAELSGGRCTMSRSGVFYAVKAMERVAAGSAADDVPDVPARQLAARSEGSFVALVRRALAAMQQKR